LTCLAILLCQGEHAHWFDDICDSGQLTGIKKFLMKQDRAPEVVDIIKYNRISFLNKFNNQNALSEIINKMKKNNGRDNPYFDIGIKRVILGSVIFEGGNVSAFARRNHKQILNEYIENITLDDFEEIFIDLTTKTTQEIWMGVEDPTPVFDLTFLYSLLYSPALFYHDQQEEILWRELKGEWSVPDKLIEINTKSVGHIELVGSKLNIYYNDRPDLDDRFLLRIWQIRAVYGSFVSVMPADVRDAYESVAQGLENLILKKHPSE